MSWHCEDASIVWAQLPAVTREWHEVVDRLRARFDAFDDWGVFAYTNGATGIDFLAEIDVGIWEQRLDDQTWAAWVDAKREIARISLRHGGSISACHGSCRAGEVELVPEELGHGYEIMRQIKRTLDPNNVMNPGKYDLDAAGESPEAARESR
jgi:glycolate oxidase